MSSRFWRAGGNAIGPNSGFLAGAVSTATVWTDPTTDWFVNNGGLTAERTGTATFWGYELSSAAKTNWTVLFTVNVIGLAAKSYVGVNDGTEASNPGTNHSIFWANDGLLTYAGGTIATLATWTTGDQLKIVKAAANVSFYKWNGTSWAQQGSTIDTSSGTYGLGGVLAGNAYASLASQNNTGFKVTADFSGF